jgi:hypothetical protein
MVVRLGQRLVREVGMPVNDDQTAATTAVARL